MGTREESIGFGAVSEEDFDLDDVPAAGCLSGYKLGFDAPKESPTVGRKLSIVPVTLQGVITINSASLADTLEIYEIE